MDAETFPDKRVKNLIATYYVPVRIEADKNSKMMQDYSVPGLPTIVILDKDGKVLENIIGFKDAAALSSILEEVAKKKR